MSLEKLQTIHSTITKTKFVMSLEMSSILATGFIDVTIYYNFQNNLNHNVINQHNDCETEENNRNVKMCLPNFLLQTFGEITSHDFLLFSLYVTIISKSGISCGFCGNKAHFTHRNRWGM
jgi:hypothetical protein